MVKAKKDKPIVVPVREIVIGKSVSPKDENGVMSSASFAIDLHKLQHEESKAAGRVEGPSAGGKVTNKDHKKRGDEIRAIWASGNFVSRDACAIQEWEAVGYKSEDTARNNLTGTPDPNPWPAKLHPLPLTKKTKKSSTK